MSGQPLAAIKPARRALATAAGNLPAPTPSPPATEQDNGKIINEFQADTVELDTAPEPLSVRLTLWLLAAMLVTAIIWGSIARIDRIVMARGKIISSAPNIIIQPLDAAVIRSVNVKTGDVVQAGQVLATLDPTFAQADVDQLEGRLANLNTAVARLEAEQNRQPFKPGDSDRFGYGMLQYAIWQERLEQYKAQQRLFDERIARARTGIAARQHERQYLASRLKILTEVEAMRVELEQGKTGSRLNSLMARDARIEIERNMVNTENILTQTAHELEATEAERDVFNRQWDSRIVEEMVTKRNERESLQEQLVKARRRQEMVRLETPVDAVVLEIAQRSVGSIIKDAEPFFKLVPMNAPLEIEAEIEARDLGHVALNDPVQVKIDAYPYQEHGMITGKVVTISGDAFNPTSNSPDSTKSSFYRARIALDAVSLYNIPDTFRLIPGMPLSAEIKVGSRSIMAYFLRPLLKGLGESMREP